jgi:ABC-type molybdenum transport system ATPase subunit/photorepair protein PhrA
MPVQVSQQNCEVVCSRLVICDIKLHSLGVQDAYSCKSVYARGQFASFGTLHRRVSERETWPSERDALKQPRHSKVHWNEMRSLTRSHATQRRVLLAKAGHTTHKPPKIHRE